MYKSMYVREKVRKREREERERERESAWTSFGRRKSVRQLEPTLREESERRRTGKEKGEEGWVQGNRRLREGFECNPLH